MSPYVLGILVGANLASAVILLWSMRPVSRRRGDQQIELLIDMAHLFATGKMDTVRGRFWPAMRLTRLTTISGTVSTFMLTAQILAAIVDEDDEVRWAYVREQIEAALERGRRKEKS